MSEFSTASEAWIKAPEDGPAFFLNWTHAVHLAHLNIAATVSGIIVKDSALIRLTNVAIEVSRNVDGIGLSREECVACNVVIDSDNAPLVVENTYWVLVVDSVFDFLPVEYSNGSTVAVIDQGQRPTVILRGRGPCSKYKCGNNGVCHDGNCTCGLCEVDTVYMVRIERVVLSGGGIQYQQIGIGEQDAGYFDFVAITMERSAAPLFDVQSAAGDAPFSGVQSVLIEDSSQADLGTPHYLQQYSYNNVPIVALNCSAGPRQAETCHLDGVTMIGASRIEGTVKPGPAIRVFRGWVNDATILNSALTGPSAVVGPDDRVVGQWLAQTGDGLLAVGPSSERLGAVASNDASFADPARRDSMRGHVLTVATDGDTAARMAIGADGAIRYGDGHATEFDTVLRRQVSNSTNWDPPRLAQGEWANCSLFVSSAEPGDIATAAHAMLGVVRATLDARVVRSGVVAVLLHNVGEPILDVGGGVVRVAVAKFA